MGATVVDSLLVTLDLDSTKFDAGVGKVLAKLKELEAAAKDVKLGEGLDSAGNKGKDASNRINAGMGRSMMAVGLLTAAVYKLNSALGLPALKRMAQETVDSETRTLRLANSLQLNSVAMQAWQKSIQLQGGDVGSFNASLEKMSANLGKLGTNVRGAKILQQYLGLAGVTDSMVQGKDALGVLQLFGQQMQGMSVERQFLVGRKLGLDDATIRTLQETGPMISQQVAEMKQLAATNEELQNSRQVAIAQREANLEWERAQQVISTSFLPVLQKLASTLKAASQWIREHQDTVRKAVIIVGAALAGLAVVATAASLAILAAGIKIAIGMTLATGGLSAVGVVAGIAALTGLATAATLSASSFESVTDKHAEMVDELLNGDAKMQNAYRHQKLLAEYTRQAANALNDLIEQIKKVDAEMSKAGGGVKWRWRLGGVLDPHFEYEGADEKKLAELAKKKAALEKRYSELGTLEAARLSALEAGKAQAWALNPKEAARIASGIGAAQDKAANVVHVDNITVHVGDHAQADHLALDINTKRFHAASGGREVVQQIAGGTR
jgi:hypothetical protein